MRLIAGDLSPQSGTVTVSGGLGVMRQFVGGFRGSRPGWFRGCSHRLTYARIWPPGGQQRS
ncbi:MAG TPA: hypothetical protein VMV92_04045 [Streptosporangiaceae bacterium]|nr:hypothetical protein [Streptosporangiaceae bacterium]